MILPMNPLGPDFQSHQMHRAWPQAAAALQETFFPSPDWGRTIDGKYNFAGYMLRAMQAYERRCLALYPDSPPSHEAMDRAAAREFRYQAKRRHAIKNAPAFLYRCLFNLPYERPERIQEAVAGTRLGGTEPQPGRSQRLIDSVTRSMK